MTKAEAIDVAAFYNGTHASGEATYGIGWGVPTVYQELWFKMLLPNYYEAYNCTVWNLGGSDYEWPYPPPDDEFTTQYWYPGPAHPCIVTLYDASDNQLASGQHIQFTTLGKMNTWVYLKVVQPEPHFNRNIFCNAKIKIRKIPRGYVYPGTYIVQDVNKLAVGTPASGTEGQVHNFVFPEKTGHSIGGGAGDILLTGVNCIADAVAGGISIRNKNYVRAVTFPIGSIVYNISANADRVNDFWVSYQEGGVNKCRAVTVNNPGDGTVTASLGPVMGITGAVDRLRARANQILYYVLQGEYIVRQWDIANNVELPPLYPNNPNLGVITDVLVIPGGDVLIGFNTATNPTTYTIRRLRANGDYLRDYVFTSNGVFNRLNYTEDNNVFCIWTHEAIGISTFRRVRISDGVVAGTTNFKEYENDGLIIVNDLYFISIPYYVENTPREPSQVNGFTNRYNFWVSPVYVTSQYNTVDSEGILIGPPAPPPDDEYYPPVLFPPLTPPTYPTLPGNPPVPAPEPPPEIPPYPGYPWVSPPPPLPNDPPLKPPSVVPLPVKIGGGLVLLDPKNATRSDVYQGTDNFPVSVPIKVNVRTALIGE